MVFVPGICHRGAPAGEPAVDLAAEDGAVLMAVTPADFTAVGAQNLCSVQRSRSRDQSSEIVKAFFFRGSSRSMGCGGAAA